MKHSCFMFRCCGFFTIFNSKFINSIRYDDGKLFTFRLSLFVYTNKCLPTQYYFMNIIIIEQRPLYVVVDDDDNVSLFDDTVS